MVLAIFGRGVQQVRPRGSWEPTEDFETQIHNGTVPAHSAVRLPIDQENPLCLVGGGELNILAGVELCRRFQPHVVVAAFGNRSKYLRDVPNSPSESEVMSDRFLREIRAGEIHEPEVVVWPRDRMADAPSNSRQEIINILELALEKRLFQVGIVTVTVHVPRTALFVSKVREENPHLRGVEVRLFGSETALVQANPIIWAPRVAAIYQSPAFPRTAAFEQRGIELVLKGEYRTTG